MIEFKNPGGTIQVQVSAGNGRWSLIDSDAESAAKLLGDSPVCDSAWVKSADGQFRVAASAVSEPDGRTSPKGRAKAAAKGGDA